VRFARSLVETGLIDEYCLVVHPVVLGAGRRIFTAPLTIKPTSTTVSSGEPSPTSSRRTRDLSPIGNRGAHAATSP
jgi:dihydrofolate reductase